jgi:hypothetical protein
MEELFDMNVKLRSIMIVAIVSLVILAGCTNRSEEVITTGIGETVEAIGNSVQDIGSDWSAEMKNDGIHKELSLSQEVGSASVLLLDNEVGNIGVTSNSTNEISVNATISFPDKPSREAKYLEILNNAEVSFVAQGDELEIITHPKGNDKLSMWKWAEDEYGFSDFSIDYAVELPDSINQYEIVSNVGEIKLVNLKGSYDVKSDVGTITIEGAQIQGKSTIRSEVGSIELGMDQMESDSNLNVETEVGSIRVILDETVQCSLKVNSDLGRVVGAPKGKSELNGGGSILSLTSAVGSITVEKP